MSNFVKLNISLLNSPLMVTLYQQEGIEGWGVVLALFKYLVESQNNCVGALKALPIIAKQYSKRLSTVERIVTDYGLFVIDRERGVFHSPYLSQSMRKRGASAAKNGQMAAEEAAISGFPPPETPQTTVSEATCDGAKGQDAAAQEGARKEGKVVRQPTAYRPQTEHLRRNQTVSASQLVDNQHKLSVDIDIDKERDKEKERDVGRESAAAEAVAVSRGGGSSSADSAQSLARHNWTFIHELYFDHMFFSSLEQLTGLAVGTERKLCSEVLYWFHYQCLAKSKRLASMVDAKRYLTALLQRDRLTRANFMSWLNKRREAQCKAASPLGGGAMAAGSRSVP